MIGRRLSGILAWSAAALLLGCLDRPTETTNPPTGLHGRLVDGQGRPVAGATVKLYRVESAPLKRSAASGFMDSARTDAQGFYSVTDMLGGDYNVLGSYNNGGLMVLIPGVSYDSAFASVDLGTDTLRVPGQIKGQVTQDGEGKAGIFCYLPGTSFLSISDEKGKFWIYNVPQGIYEVLYRYPGLETLVDSGVVVRSGEITALEPRSIGPDPSFPPPAPADLRAVYDTLTGSARLEWPAVAVPDLDGYVVYRIDSASASPMRVSAGLVRDTVFRDTIFRDFFDTSARRVTYRVKSQDLDVNLSATFSPAAIVEAAPPTLFHTTIGISVRTRFGDTAVIGDEVRLIAAFANPLRTLASATWIVDGDTLRTGVLGRRSGSDTLVHAFPLAGFHRVVVDFRDLAGVRWRDSLDMEVLLDPPEAHAGREATVLAGLPTILTGRGFDRFGIIVQYAWDFDMDGVYDDSSAGIGDVARTYPTEGPRKHLLRVQDDDGNFGYDTLSFTVGGAFLGDLYTSDLRVKKSGSPYYIQGNNVLSAGTIMIVEPGVTFRFARNAQFTIRGTLICEGTPSDSIHMVGAEDSSQAPSRDHVKPALLFEGGPGATVLDTTHVSGSRLRYVRFRGLTGIDLERTAVTIEDCTFRQVVATASNSVSASGIVLLVGGGPDNDAWICRRNRFLETQGVAIKAILGSSGPNLENPRLRAGISGNSIQGTGGISIQSGNSAQGLFTIEDNEIRLSGPNQEVFGVGIGYQGPRPARIRNNLIVGAVEGFNFGMTADVEVAHNEVRGCSRIWYDGGYKGRFHHNQIGAGMLEMNNFQNQMAAYDSNAFEAGVRLSWEFGPAAKPLDLRNNFWSTLDVQAIKQALGMTVNPESVRLEPILSAPPPGVGRGRPVLAGAIR